MKFYLKTGNSENVIDAVKNWKTNSLDCCKMSNNIIKKRTPAIVRHFTAVISSFLSKEIFSEESNYLSFV